MSAGNKLPKCLRGMEKAKGGGDNGFVTLFPSVEISVKLSLFR